MKTTPKDFFLWLGAMATLYVSAVSLITLLFQYIEHAFRDELSYYADPFSGAIRFSIASLVVLFPLFVYLMRQINQDLRANPEKKDLWVRRWLVHITLFIAGVTLIVDLITLINFFLGGDLTTQFLLKVAAVFVVIGTIFVYFLYSLRGYWDTHEKESKMIAWLAGAVILATIGSGFFIIGSPQTQRELRFDQERVQDLQTIQSQLVNFWQQKGELPVTLAELEDPIIGFQVPTDPQTAEAYEYVRSAAQAFELCATFAQPSPENRAGESIAAPLRSFGENWSHDAGKTCFQRTIDPELFPVKESALR